MTYRNIQDLVDDGLACCECRRHFVPGDVSRPVFGLRFGWFACSTCSPGSGLNAEQPQSPAPRNWPDCAVTGARKGSRSDREAAESPCRAVVTVKQSAIGVGGVRATTAQLDHLAAGGAR